MVLCHRLTATTITSDAIKVDMISTVVLIKTYLLSLAAVLFNLGSMIRKYHEAIYLSVTVLDKSRAQ